MDIRIKISPEQEKALLTAYSSVEAFVQDAVDYKANQIIERIVNEFADNLTGVTVAERSVIDSEIAGRVIVDSSSLSDEVKKIIVSRSPIKTLAEKIAEQDAAFALDAK